MSLKRRIIVAIIILFVVLGIVLYVFYKRKSIKISNIKRFHFSYSVGYHYEASFIYNVDIVDGKYQATIKKEGVTIEDAKKVIITKKDVNKIEEILKKYKVNSWNGFNKSNKYVLDGDSFSLYVTFEDETEIDASGYMMYPKNYNNVQGELDKLFNEFYER